MIKYSDNQKSIEHVYNMKDISLCRIQNIDAVRVQIEASLNGKNFSPIGAFSSKDNSFVTEIKTAGIFYFDTRGIEFIKVIKNETRVQVIIEGID